MFKMSFRRLYLTTVLVIIISCWGNAQDSSKVIIACPSCDKAFLKQLPGKSLGQQMANKKLSQFLFNLQLSGYFEPNIDTIVVDHGLEIKVHPGQKYIWKSLNIQGLPDESLKSSGFEKNGIDKGSFNIRKFMDLTEKIISHNENNGYPFASLGFSSASIEDFEINADLTFHLGPKITFDTLKVTVPEKIKPMFLASYLDILPGALYDQRMVDQIDKKLTGLPYLRLNEKMVTFQNEEALVTLDLEPVEANRFEGILGLAPNQDEGVLLTGQIDLLLQNLFRSGKMFGFEWRRLRAASQYLKINYHHPRLFTSPLDGSFYFSLLKQDSAFLNRNMNFSLGLDVDARTNLQFVTEYRFSNSISKISGEDMDFPNLKWLSYGIEFRWDMLDHRYFPKNGTLFNIKSLIGNKRVSEDGQYGKYVQLMTMANLDNHLPIASRFVLFNRLSAGFFKSKSLYRNELFQLGGLNDLRGFNENEFVVKQYLLANVEARFFIEERSYFMAFYDQAFLNVPSQLGTMRINPSGLGAGMSLNVKSGLLKLIYAIGSSKHQPFDLNYSKIHFGFETVF